MLGTLRGRGLWGMTERWRSPSDRDRDWGDAAPSPGTRRTRGHHCRNLGGGREALPPAPETERSPAYPVTVTRADCSLQHGGTAHFGCWNRPHPLVCSVVTAAPAMEPAVPQRWGVLTLGPSPGSISLLESHCLFPSCSLLTCGTAVRMPTSQADTRAQLIREGSFVQCPTNAAVPMQSTD